MAKKRTIKTGRLVRSFSFDRSAINAEDRTVALAFSSEEPVERWFGMEVLDHSAGAADLGRLNDGAPLLFNHNFDQHIGTIESAQLEGKVGRAVVRFGKSALAEEKFQDVQDGILTKVSFAYDPKEMVLESTQKDGPDTYRVTRWMAFEISMVTIPADNTVGIGRSMNKDNGDIEVPVTNSQEERTMEKCEKCGATLVDGKCPECAARAAASLVTAATPAAPSINLAAERQRIADITALGRKYDLPDDADDAVRSGASAESFCKVILDKRGTKPVQVDLSNQETQQYSILRAINSAAHGDSGFEHEVSQQIAKQLGRSSKGIFVPLSLRAPLNATTAGEGGNLVPTNLMPLIEILRNKMLVRSMGATVLSGLTGNVAFPRQTGAATLYWVGENPVSDTTETEATFDQLVLTPKTAQATTAFSRQLLQQSSTDAEAFVRNDLMAVNAIGVDYAAINGTGQNNQPTGVRATANIGAVVGGTDGALPTWAHIVALESKVAAGNAGFGSLGYLTTPKVRGILKTTPKFTNTGLPIWGNGEGGFGELNGYRAGVSNQVPSTLSKGGSGAVCSSIIFGNWADLLIGEFGVMEIIADPYSLKKKGAIEVTTFIMVDLGVRHAASFAKMDDALTTGQ